MPAEWLPRWEKKRWSTDTSIYNKFIWAVYRAVKEAASACFVQVRFAMFAYMSGASVRFCKLISLAQICNNNVFAFMSGESIRFCRISHIWKHWNDIRRFLFKLAGAQMLDRSRSPHERRHDGAAPLPRPVGLPQALGPKAQPPPTTVSQSAAPAVDAPPVVSTATAPQGDPSATSAPPWRSPPLEAQATPEQPQQAPPTRTQAPTTRSGAEQRLRVALMELRANLFLLHRLAQEAGVALQALERELFYDQAVD